ncbi:GNAT family N-acetyltransferase [Streptomyces sp. NPDC020983]|uniref:GNAT family N-acetyltransferase n=1 Tax=Streptomyces sp. NPDC020983 TaxID=3365106 RepID=UPI0037A1BDC1
MPANPSPLSAPTAEDLHAWYRVQSAAFAHDRPGEPVPSHAAVQARLTAPGGRRQVLWLLRSPASDPVATASLRLPAGGAAGSTPGDAPTDRNGGVAGEIRMTVHPAHRRLGTGSRLLATVTEAAAAEGCGTLVGEVTSGTSGEGFLATRGFVPVLRRTWQRLALEDVPAPVAELPGVPHPGYRLTAWEGAAPGALAEGFTAALRSLPPLPPEAGLAPGATRWDASCVHETAELAARRGDRLLTVAALHDTGDLVGYATVLLPGDGARRARQYDTAVVPGHRGHGLALWMTAELLRRLTAAHPGLTELHTAVPDDNRHLLTVNAALGFRPLRRTVRYRHRLRTR